MQNTRDLFFRRKQKSGRAAPHRSPDWGSSKKLLLPESKYPDIHTSRYSYSGPYSKVCRIRPGGGLLANCLEAINETMPITSTSFAQHAMMYPPGRSPEEQSLFTQGGPSWKVQKRRTTRNQWQTDPNLTPNRFHTDPRRTPHRFQTDSKPYPNEF